MTAQQKSLKPITIAGGGLAGLTLGIGLRKQGIPVTIWESGHYPRHRVCGEFISGEGQEVLRKFGLDAEFYGAGARTATTAAFLTERVAGPARPLPRSALCLSRFRMDTLLAERFRSLNGTLRENARWPEGPGGEGIVQATGRRRATTAGKWRWLGLKVHARNVSLEADLEMHARPGGYVGLCRLSDGEVNVCGLFRRPSTGNEPFSWEDLLRGEPGTPLFRRMEGADIQDKSFCSVAALSLEPHRAAAQEAPRIGDALTMIPPVTGNGMSMALEAAELSVEPLAQYSRGDISWAEASREICRLANGRFARRLFWARWLQSLMFSPVLHTRMAASALGSRWLWDLFFQNTR